MPLRAERGWRRRPAPSEDAPAPPAADWFAMAVAARARRRSARDVVGIVSRALSLVRAAGPRPFAFTAVLQVAAAVLTVVTVVVAKLALDTVIPSNAGAAVVVDAQTVLVVVLLVLTSAFSGIIGSAMTLWQRLLSELTVRKVWEGILGVTEEVDLAYFESSEFYDQLERVRISALGRPAMISSGLLNVIGGLFGTIGVAVALLTIQPVLVPLLFLSGVPLWLTSKRASQIEFDFVVRQTPTLRVRHYLTQVLTGRAEAKEVRAFALAKTLQAQYDRSYGDYVTDLRTHISQRHRLTLVGMIGSALLTAATLALLLWLLSRGRVSLAQAGAALLGVQILGGRIRLLLSGVSQLFESALFLEDYYDFLGLPRRLPPAATSGALRSPAATSTSRADHTDAEVITAEGVSFIYPGATEAVLRDVSMAVLPGQVVALVGENGSGKTTLAKLLAGLYEPTAGRITRGGVDLRELNREEVRRNTAVIFQDFVRYQLSAQHNIGLGRPEAVDDLPAVAAAARQAGADAFIERLPAGFATILSKEYVGGVDLSLGQWQRVALARAFYRDAPFVILDEPSASLDARAEHQLFESIRSLLAGRTVLLISHRFSTVRTADHIYVLRKGRIVEHGGHDDLMREAGLYAELFELQAAAYLPRAEPQP